MKSQVSALRVSNHNRISCFSARDLVMYWGNDAGNCQFDILAIGTRIAADT